MTTTIVLIVASGFLWTVVRAFSSIRFDRGRNFRWWAGLFASTILMLGLVGFLGSAASATGQLNWLPPSFEWPVGTVSNAVTTKDGLNIVPNVPSGRIQIYDADWKFLRGWPIEAGGGVFKLFLREEGRIHVATARGRRHLVYSLDGDLMSNSSCEPNSFNSFPDQGRKATVPTSLWLWPMSNPAVSWAFGFFGMVFLIAARSRVKPN